MNDRTMRFRSLCLALVLLGASACHHFRGTAAAPKPAWSPVASMEPVYYDNSGGISDSLQLVVRTPQELRTIWARATSHQRTPPPPPTVDFAREMLVVVAAGRQTPDDRIVVDSAGIRRPPGGAAGEPVLNVFASLNEGCHRFQADAYPVEIVRVPRFDGRVRFHVQSVKPTDCE